MESRIERGQVHASVQIVTEDHHRVRVAALIVCSHVLAAHGRLYFFAFFGLFVIVFVSVCFLLAYIR